MADLKFDKKIALVFFQLCCFLKFLKVWNFISVLKFWKSGLLCIFLLCFHNKTLFCSVAPEEPLAHGVPLAPRVQAAPKVVVHKLYGAIMLRTVGAVRTRCTAYTSFPPFWSCTSSGFIDCAFVCRTFYGASAL